jgi:hypothetical protein
MILAMTISIVESSEMGADQRQDGRSSALFATRAGFERGAVFLLFLS